MKTIIYQKLFLFIVLTTNHNAINAMIQQRDIINNYQKTAQLTFVCTTCNKNFSKKYNLTQHIKIHIGEKPYSCDICYKSFIQKSDCTKHIKTHTKEKPYSCKICDKRFSLKPYLAQHIKFHTGEKPYACTQCEKSFTTNNSRARHAKIHTGEKPYSCHRCSQCFITSCECRKHLATHKSASIEEVFLQKTDLMPIYDNLSSLIEYLPLQTTMQERLLISY